MRGRSEQTLDTTFFSLLSSSVLDFNIVFFVDVLVVETYASMMNFERGNYFQFSTWTLHDCYQDKKKSEYIIITNSKRWSLRYSYLEILSSNSLIVPVWLKNLTTSIFSLCPIQSHHTIRDQIYDESKSPMWSSPMVISSLASSIALIIVILFHDV